MNQIIKEIATEVGISVEYLNNTKQWSLIEGFAELIVKECGRVMEEKDSYYGEWMKTVINAHFGVK